MKKGMKIRAIVAAVVIGGTGTTASAQGVPVIDAANLVQALLEMQSWMQQYQQMVTQIQALQTQVQQLGGARGLGTILQDPSIQALLPEDVLSAGALLNSPLFSEDQQAAVNTLLESYGIQSVVEGINTSNGQDAAAALAKMQQMLQSAKARSQQNTALAARVNTSADTKDGVDMLGRIGLEQAAINNQLLQAITTIEANRRADELRAAAAWQRKLARDREAILAPIE